MSSLILKYLSEEDIKTLHLLQNAVKKKNITVTCLGLYNHGKSTLLNNLIKDFEYKTFKTEDARETAVNKSVEYGNVMFVDTPGLNYSKDDDENVMGAVRESDINLFVHAITTGEFAASEIVFMNNVKEHWANPQEFIERTIFILSRIDKAIDQEDINNASKRMKQQIEEIFQSECMLIAISSSDYKEGMIGNERELVEESNIELLEKTLDEMSTKFKETIIQTKKNRLEKNYTDLITKLNSKVQQNKVEINKIKANRQKFQDLLSKDIQEIEFTLKNMYTNIGV